MKNLLLALCLALCSMTAHATNLNDISSIDVSKLTPEQKTELMSSVAKLQTQTPDAATSSEKIRTEASKWADLGTNMGKAAVSAAKELGVAANDFMQTPVGKVTMAIIIYKIVGADILGVVVGAIILIFFLGLALYLFTRKPYKSIKYENRSALWGLFNRKLVVEASEIDEGSLIAHKIFGLISIVLGLAVGLKTIF